MNLALAICIASWLVGAALGVCMRVTFAERP